MAERLVTLTRQADPAEAAAAGRLAAQAAALARRLGRCTGPADTGPVTRAADTGPVGDTGPADTGPADTGPATQGRLTRAG